MATTEVTNAEKCRVIAERVMGWTRISVAPLHWPIPMELTNALTGTTIKPYGGPWFIPPGMAVTGSPAFGVEIPDFFTDPAAMVELMEKIGSKAHNCRCVVLRITEEDGQWDCTIGLPDDHEGDSVDTRGPTPMHAVAEAAYAWAVK